MINTDDGVFAERATFVEEGVFRERSGNTWGTLLLCDDKGTIVIARGESLTIISIVHVFLQLK